jgi:ribose transport system permease protein
MTRGGRHIRAVGGDITAARRAGLPTERIKFFSLLASSFGASIGGILYVGKLGSAPVTLGTNMEFTIYAALMIGGYSILRGGVGNPMGGFLGLLIIAVFANLVDNKGLDIRAADIFVGFLLLVIVFLDIRRGGDAFE